MCYMYEPCTSTQCTTQAYDQNGKPLPYQIIKNVKEHYLENCGSGSGYKGSSCSC